MSSLREAILAIEDRKSVEVEVPEWGGKFIVRELSGTERGELEYQISQHAKKGNFRKVYRALVTIASLYDESGTRVFSYDDLDALNEKSGKALERLSDAADRANAISNEAIEDLAKN